MAHSTQTSGVTSTAGYQVGDGYVTLTWTDQTAGSRTFPAPVHTSATQYSGADLRTLTTTDPAAEVSTTIRASAITGRSGYFRPNQTDGVAQAVLGYGQAKKWGWVFNPVGPIVPSNTTAWILSGGNFTVPLHHSRPGGLGTGDVNNTFTVLFFRMSSDLTTVKHELGRVTGAQVATTTTEQVQTLTVPLDSSYFEPGDLILMEIHQVQAGAITVDNVRVHTGSATATRISAGPLYTIKYVRAQAHTVTPTDAQYRKLTSRRQHDEATSVVQSQTRRVTYPRKHEKTVPAPVAAQVRSVVAHRLHPESAPVADQQYRRIETHRLHDEDTLVAQVQHRRLEMHRRHDQTVPTPVDTQQRKLIARRRHDEAVPTPADTQSRSLVLHRSHAEDAAVVQTQLRRATYRRRHDEALSEGGAQTPYPDGLLRLRPDGRIEAVNANIGALPPGALRITTAA